MRIKSSNNETPKQYAEELLMLKIRSYIKEWHTEELEVYGMKLTKREIEAIDDQMDKIGNRLMKVLRYEPDL